MTGGQAGALIVIEQDMFLAEHLSEHLAFDPQVIEHLLLLSIDPASKNHEEELPRLQDKAHGEPDREAETTHNVARRANSQQPRQPKDEFQGWHKLRSCGLLLTGATYTEHAATSGVLF